MGLTLGMRAITCYIDTGILKTDDAVGVDSLNKLYAILRLKKLS